MNDIEKIKIMETEGIDAVICVEMDCYRSDLQLLSLPWLECIRNYFKKKYYNKLELGGEE